MNSQVWWFTARAGGIVAWVVLTASVLWGLALSTKATRGHVRPSWMLDLHRYLGGLGVIFTAVHVIGLVADSSVHFGPVELLVPFTGDWHPVAVGWGIISAYLLLAVELTSLAKRRLPKRIWRLTHFASFPLFGLATVHGLTAGTDGTNPVLLVAMAASVVAVGALTSLRIWQATHTPNRAVHRPASASSPVAAMKMPGRPAIPATLAPARQVPATNLPEAPAAAFFVPAPAFGATDPPWSGVVPDPEPFDFESISPNQEMSVS